MDTFASNRYQTPMDFFKVIFRRKNLIIFPAYFGLVLGIMACFLLPPQWQSSTILLIEEEKIINPLIQNLAVSTSAQQRMESIREVILSWNSLVDLVHKLGLDRRVANQQSYEDMIKELKKNIEVQMRPPNVVVLSYFGKTAQETQLVAKSLTDILIERNMKTQTKETDVAISFISEQLLIYKKKIKSSEIAEIEDKLKALLIDSTEEHPMVKELRGKLDTARRELNSGEYEVKTSAAPINAATKEALEKELDKVLHQNATDKPVSPDDASASIYKMMLMDKAGTSMAQDIDVNKNIYNMLLQRLETAKITQRLEASREGTRYTILDPARLPLNPVKPARPLVILMGVFLGLGFGVGLVFMRELMDHSILDIEDAKNSLPLLVLGAIPRITTVEELARERIRGLTAFVFSLIIGVFLIVVAVMTALLRGAPHV